MASSRESPPIFTDVDVKKSDDVEDDLFQSAMEEPARDPSMDSIGNGPFSSSDDVSTDFAAVKTKKEETKVRDWNADAVSTSSTLGSKINYFPDSSAGDTASTGRFTKEFQRSDSPDEDAESQDKFPITITISEPQKVNEGLNAFVQYKVQTETSLPIFKKKKFSVLRRFSDFLGLHEKLAEKHLHVGRFVPPAPEKSVAGMAKVKLTKGDTTQQESGGGEFVERRRAALERYLNRTAQHPVLRMDPDFREFLEMDEALPKASSTSAFSGAGMMRLFNRVGEQVTRMTGKIDEKDEWFEEKTTQVENMETQLKKLHASVEVLFHHRRDLANSTGIFAKSAAMLANCEEHTSLSRALSQLAETEEKIDLLYQEQANVDSTLFADLLRDYIGLLGSVKEVLHQRVKIHTNWTTAQTTLAKKREAKVRLELNGKHDKVQAAQDEVREWEDKVENGERDFDAISAMIKKEMERFDRIRVKDFKETLVKYLEALMLHQQQLIKYWEAFIPEARSISTS